MADEPVVPRQRDAYPHHVVVPTRWHDNDVYGHVNNVVYYAYFDTAINTWLVEEGGLDIHEGPVIGVCAASRCDFLGPVTFPDAVEAHLRVGRLGRTSARYELALYRRSRVSGPAAEPAAAGWFVHVFVDRSTRRPVPIPDRLRAALQRLAVAGTP